jgi:hypothetical protein
MSLAENRYNLHLTCDRTACRIAAGELQSQIAEQDKTILSLLMRVARLEEFLKLTEERSSSWSCLNWQWGKQSSNERELAHLANTALPEPAPRVTFKSVAVVLDKPQYQRHLKALVSNMNSAALSESIRFDFDVELASEQLSEASLVLYCVSAASCRLQDSYDAERYAAFQACGVCCGACGSVC